MKTVKRPMVLFSLVAVVLMVSSQAYALEAEVIPNIYSAPKGISFLEE